ncbi:MAG: sulfurtransferase TusA family protein [Bacteroidia bacterium]|nr:sulfurtransferase TusA family protein [Bacteroidia bacterium]
MFGFLKRLFSSNKQSVTSNISQDTSVVSSKSGTVSSHFVLNCQNMNCPMPIVKISVKFKELQVGDILEVTATDPAFKPDLEAWIRKTGHELIQFDDQKIKKAIIRKVTTS